MKGIKLPEKLEKEIVRLLVKNREVRLTGLVTLRIKKMKERRTKAPGTGELIIIPPHNFISSKVSVTLKNKVIKKSKWGGE